MTLSRTLLAFLVATTILSQVFISGLVSAQDDFIPDEIPTTSRSEETVVAWDNFASADGGLFAEQPREPDDLRIAYDDGQFEIDALPEDFSGNLEAPTFDAYSDATLAVDGVLVGSSRSEPARYLYLGCRTDGDTGYRLEYRPDLPQLVLRRVDADTTSRLASTDLDPVEFTNVDLSRRFEISCIGSEIIGRIDGQQLVTATDSTYTEGQFVLGVGVYTISSGPVSADFDDLAISVPIAQAPEMKTDEDLDRLVIPDQVEELQNRAGRFPPVSGPSTGNISQALDARYADVDLVDFVATATFTTPPEEDATGVWDIGFGFRQDDSGEHWRIIVKSDRTWSLAVGPELPRASGLVDTLDLTPGTQNQLDLLVSGDTGYLLVNDAFVALLDLSAWTASGDIWVSAGFFPESADSAHGTRFTEFAVWTLGEDAPTPTPTQAPQGATGSDFEPDPTGTPELPAATPEATPLEDGTPVEASAATDPAADFALIREDLLDSDPDFGPESGEVTQSLGAIDIESAGVSVENFYTRARFSNPASPDDPDHPWDILIGFWHQGGDDQVRFVISSDGTWSAAEGTARPIINGEIGNLNLGAARGNDIELAVQDGIGFLTINGEFVDSFEVPGNAEAGDIWVASGTFPENVQDGVDTPFSDWVVWSLDES